jgi:hypothetical protein
VSLPVAVRLWIGALVGLVAFLAAPLCAQQENVSQDKPVKAVGDKQFLVTAPEGSGTLRYFGTGSLDGNAQATRALIVIHGLLRNADEYERTGEAVLAASHASGANTLLITPQSLVQIDVTAHGLPAARYAGSRRPGTMDIRRPDQHP